VTVRRGERCQLRLDTDRAGANRLRFTARLRAKKLDPGRYRLRAVAQNGASKSSPPTTKSFRIKR
jgi:hypothetical protein